MYCHRNNDSRACGAVTVVTGQDFVRVNGELWAVHGDPNNHGSGNLIASVDYIKINGLNVIVLNDNASADNLVLGPHSNPKATGYDSLINVQ